MDPAKQASLEPPTAFSALIFGQLVKSEAHAKVRHSIKMIRIVGMIIPAMIARYVNLLPFMLLSRALRMSLASELMIS